LFTFKLWRPARSVDRVELARRLSVGPLCCPSAPATSGSDVGQLFDTYNTVLLAVADQLAPSHVICRRPGRPTLWFDADCRAHRRECHRLERRYRRKYRPDDRRRWVEATRRRFSVYRNKRDEYWSNRLLQSGRSSAAQCGVPCRQCSVAATLPLRPATPLKVLSIFFQQEDRRHPVNDFRSSVATGHQSSVVVSVVVPSVH